MSLVWRKDDSSPLLTAPLKVTLWKGTSEKCLCGAKIKAETKAEHLLVSPVTEFLAELMLILFCYKCIFFQLIH